MRADSTTSNALEASGSRTVDVGPVEAFPDGSVRRVVAGRRALVVVHHGGRWHAMRDRCPHQGAPLSNGRIVEYACAHLERGRPVFGAATPSLQCPWHGWSFRLADGASPVSPNVRVRSYPIRVVAGRVTVELPSR
jgi:3-phenylpropionate/trans-cinnamate dioxygenase ferredoxin subunit